jgi:hypothetical protein
MTNDEEFSMTRRKNLQSIGGFFTGLASGAEQVSDAIWLNQHLPAERLGRGSPKSRDTWLSEVKSHSEQVRRIENGIANIRMGNENKDLLEPSSYNPLVSFGSVALSTLDSRELPYNTTNESRDYETVMLDGDVRDLEDVVHAELGGENSQVENPAGEFVSYTEDELGFTLTDNAETRIERKLTGSTASDSGGVSPGLFDIKFYAEENENGELEFDPSQLEAKRDMMGQIANDLADLWSGSITVDGVERNLGVLIDDLNRAYNDITHQKQGGDAKFATSIPLINPHSDNEFRRRDTNAIRTGRLNTFLDNGESYGQNAEIYEAVGAEMGQIGPIDSHAWEEGYGVGGLAGQIDEAENARYAVAEGAVQAKLMETAFDFLIGIGEEYKERRGEGEPPETQTDTPTETSDPTSTSNPYQGQELELTDEELRESARMYLQDDIQSNDDTGHALTVMADNPGDGAVIFYENGDARMSSIDGTVEQDISEDAAVYLFEAYGDD